MTDSQIVNFYKTSIQTKDFRGRISDGEFTDDGFLDSKFSEYNSFNRRDEDPPAPAIGNGDQVSDEVVDDDDDDHDHDHDHDLHSLKRRKIKLGIRLTLTCFSSFYFIIMMNG
jgi:hypothetical protein